MAKVLLTLIGGTSPGTKPLSISLLSAILKSKGHEVLLFDTTFMDLGFPLTTEISDRTARFKKIDWKKYNMIRNKEVEAKRSFIELIRKEKPDIIGASAMSDMFSDTIEFLNLAKENFDIPVIVGGVHATLMPEDTIKEGCIDYICVGEGENIINDFVEAVVNKQDISSVKNIWHKQNGQIIKNENAPLTNLDDLPFLDYSIYDERQFLRPYNGRIIKSGDITDMRGCPRLCTFCANSVLNKNYKGRLRFYSPKRFVEEALFVKKKYHLLFFKLFSEDILLRNEDELGKLSDLYKKKVNLPFTTSTHPNSVTPQKAKLLKDMNCASVSISLECGNAHYRKNILKRNYSNDRFIKVIKILNEAGIRTSAQNMIGLPYESRKMIFETIDIIRKANPKNSDCAIYFPYLSTPLGKLCLNEKFVKREEVETAKFDSSKTMLKMPQIEPQKINAISRLWSFYIYYPKLLFPFLKLLEKQSFVSDFIVKMLLAIEFKVKHVRK